MTGAGFDRRYVPLFLSGFAGGSAAFLLGLPMPFMLGGIVGTASYVLWYERGEARLPKLSSWVRLLFAALIGAMIGTRFGPDMVPLLPQFWLSVPALFAFILIAFAGNYAILRGLGRYDTRDAFFVGLPGGIVDSVVLAEQAGADLRVVTTQHFIRIILVVATVPLLFWLIEGGAVGSMAGESLATAQYDSTDVGLLIAIGLCGLFAGRRLGLPVAHLTGPLLLGLVLSVSGLISVNIPGWLQNTAQFMIGTSLGAQFSGVSRRLLVRGLGTGLVSGGYMLLLAAVFATGLSAHVPAGFAPLFISFAAGGLAEMSLIALTLSFNPVVVALHHLCRIVMTIWLGAVLSRRLLGVGRAS